MTVIIDYYKDSSETEHNRGIVHDYLLQRPGKLYVLATHFHPDHFNREILTWKEARPDIRYIFSKDILKSHRGKPENATYIKKGETYEDDTIRIDASDQQMSAVRSFFTYKIGVSSMPAT